MGDGTTVAESVIFDNNPFLASQIEINEAAKWIYLPGVVIFGGYITPNSTGYSFQTNIYSDPPCGTISGPYEHCIEIMKNISVDYIIEKVRELPTSYPRRSHSSPSGVFYESSRSGRPPALVFFHLYQRSS